MKLAVLSDIHGNLEAFEAVVEELAEYAASQVICLGDLVGYGPDPDAVVERVRELGYRCVLGNHEAALFQKSARDWMNFQAHENNVSTKGLLAPDNLAFCQDLPTSIVVEGAHFVHGCPPDSTLSYIYNLSDEDVKKLFAESPYMLMFTGHTHQLLMITIAEDKVVRTPLPLGLTQLTEKRSYLINAGSVGQPRDGDSRAKYLLWDNVAQTVEVRAVHYDIKATADKIIGRGFPEAYALRLGKT